MAVTSRATGAYLGWAMANVYRAGCSCIATRLQENLITFITAAASICLQTGDANFGGKAWSPSIASRIGFRED